MRVEHDQDKRAQLSVRQAYPPGSRWYHISTQQDVVAIIGHFPEEERYNVNVSVAGGRPQAWPRGALDKYGTPLDPPLEEPDDEVEDADLEPRRTGHPSNPPVSAQSVRDGYANMIRGINKANRLLPEEDRFHVPFGVQEALASYIEEREAIESITKGTS